MRSLPGTDDCSSSQSCCMLASTSERSMLGGGNSMSAVASLKGEDWGVEHCMATLCWACRPELRRWAGLLCPGEQMGAAVGGGRSGPPGNGFILAGCEKQKKERERRGKASIIK